MTTLKANISKTLKLCGFKGYKIEVDAQKNLITIKMNEEDKESIKASLSAIYKEVQFNVI